MEEKVLIEAKNLKKFFKSTHTAGTDYKSVRFIFHNTFAFTHCICYNKFGAFVKNNTHINKKIGCNSDCVSTCAVCASGRCAHNTVFSRTENKVVALFGNLFAEMLGRFEIDFVNLLT